jgi:hypothetical protein
VDSTTLENVSVAGQFEYCNEPWVPWWTGDLMTGWAFEEGLLSTLTITKSMELSITREAIGCAATQEPLSILWSPKVHYHTYKSSPLVLILSETILSLRSFIQRIRPSSRIFRIFITTLFFSGERLLAPHRTPELEDHPLSVLHCCLFGVFAATYLSSVCNLRTHHDVVARGPPYMAPHPYSWININSIVQLFLM